MVIIILSEKLVEVISVGTPLTCPAACFERAGKGSCLTSTGGIVVRGWVLGFECWMGVGIWISMFRDVAVLSHVLLLMRFRWWLASLHCTSLSVGYYVPRQPTNQKLLLCRSPPYFAATCLVRSIVHEIHSVARVCLSLSCFRHFVFSSFSGKYLSQECRKLAKLRSNLRHDSSCKIDHLANWSIIHHQTCSPEITAHRFGITGEVSEKRPLQICTAYIHPLHT